jgi:hypothetical protein
MLKPTLQQILTEWQSWFMFTHQTDTAKLAKAHLPRQVFEELRDF